jgi:DNA-binding response OmpR family regulator
MNSETPIILLLEDSVDVGLAAEQIIVLSLPNCRVVWARTIEEARVRLYSLPIAVFLLDVVLPDGNGLDFLWEAQQARPEARAVIMSGCPLPQYRERAKNLGALRFLEKPVPANRLVLTLREALAAHTGESLNAATSFQGMLKELTPIDILQLKCMSNASCVIFFQAAGEQGRVFFENGQIVHAESQGVSGEEALNRIVGFKGGSLQEEDPQSVKRTLYHDWQTLLMNAAHAQDVRAMGAAADAA